MNCGASPPLLRTLALAFITLGTLSCSGTSEREDRIRAVKQKDRLPKTILVEVRYATDAQDPASTLPAYGDEHELEQYIKRQFEEEFDVCAQVLCGSAVGESQPADLKLTVDISQSKELKAPLVDPAGAVLDVASWLFIPFLPLFVYDVENDPGLDVKAFLSTTEVETPVPLPRVATNMLDRYAFFSWPTLSVLVVPPFVYDRGNSKHLAQSIREEVQFEVALALAEVVKENEALKRDDLLLDLKLEHKGINWTLSYRTRDENPVYEVTLTVDGRKLPSPLVSPDDGVDHPAEVSIPGGTVGRGRFLYVVARSTTGRVERYTLTISESPSAALPLTTKTD